MVKRLTTPQFIERAKCIHKDTYDYSLTEYRNNLTKVKMVCSKHGVFEQLPVNHLSGSGCRECYLEKNINEHPTRLTTEQFVERAKAVHGDRYDYSKTVYVTAKEEIIVICPTHREFHPLPFNHLSGSDCDQCGRETGNIKKASNKNEFIEKANKAHDGKYDYSKVEYINNYTDVVIVCPQHGDFNQLPYNHIRRAGCPDCKRISKGEELIHRILERNNISFQREYKIPQAEYKFRYDFYLDEYNLFIEFHGDQHYKPVAYFGGEETFKQIQFRDAFKRKLAALVGINIVYYNCVHLAMPEQDFEKLMIKYIKGG